jgi:MerR family transcriptional regulator/heat shock protein HspR
VTTAVAAHRREDVAARPNHASRARGLHGQRAEAVSFRRDLDRPRYFISIAAELASVHPRTLRIYEEEGLLCPQRRNNIRLYSEADIQRVRVIRYLTRRQGVNLAGVKVILQLEAIGKIRVYDLFEEADVEDWDPSDPTDPDIEGDQPAGLERRSS